MSRKTAVFALAVLTAALGSPAAQFPLKLKRMSAQEAERRARYCDWDEAVEGTFSNKKPASVAAEAKAVSKYPLYGTLKLGGKTPVVFRLDESHGPGAGYDRIIVDWNANGDLRDDFAGKRMGKPDPSGENRDFVFGPIEALTGKRKGPWRPVFYAFGRMYSGRSVEKNEDVGELQLVPGCYLEATVEVSGVKQKIGFLDANCSVQLGDVTRAELRKERDGNSWSFDWGDVVLRDRNGSGRFDIDILSTETDPYCALIYFGPKPYTLELTENLESVRVEPYPGAVGKLDLKTTARVDHLLLCRKNPSGKWEVITTDPVEGLCEAPVGTYGLYSSVVDGRDKGGATISLMSFMEENPTTAGVDANGTARLACGAPLKLRVQARRSGYRSVGLLDALSSPPVSNVSTLEFNVDVIGAGGERYSTFRKITPRDESRPDPPRFKVLDDEGEVIATGQFEYG